MPVFFSERQWLLDGKERVSFGIKYTTNSYYEDCPQAFSFEAIAEVGEDRFTCTGASGIPPEKLYFEIINNAGIKPECADDIDPRTNPQLDYVFGKTIYFTAIFICAVSDGLGTLEVTEKQSLPSDAVRGEYAGMNGSLEAFEQELLTIAKNIGEQENFNILELAKTFLKLYRLELLDNQ